MELEDEHNRETEHAAAEAGNFRRDAERIARDVFKRNGIHHPNKEQIRRLAQQPVTNRPSRQPNDFPRSNLAYPDNVAFYFDHLAQLGLAGIYQQGNQEALFDTPRTSQ